MHLRGSHIRLTFERRAARKATNHKGQEGTRRSSWQNFVSFVFRDFYCGLAVSLPGGFDVVVPNTGATGPDVAGDVWEVGVVGSDFGGSGTVVIALSGLSR